MVEDINDDGGNELANTPTKKRRFGGATSGFTADRLRIDRYPGEYNEGRESYNMPPKAHLPRSKVGAGYALYHWVERGRRRQVAAGKGELLGTSNSLKRALRVSTRIQPMSIPGGGEGASCSQHTTHYCITGLARINNTATHLRSTKHTRASQPRLQLAWST